MLKYVIVDHGSVRRDSERFQLQVWELAGPDDHWAMKREYSRSSIATILLLLPAD